MAHRALFPKDRLVKTDATNNQVWEFLLSIPTAVQGREDDSQTTIQRVYLPVLLSKQLPMALLFLLFAGCWATVL